MWKCTQHPWEYWPRITNSKTWSSKITRLQRKRKKKKTFSWKKRTHDLYGKENSTVIRFLTAMFCTKKKWSNIVNIFKGKKVWVFIHYGKNDFQYKEQELLLTCKSSEDTISELSLEKTQETIWELGVSNKYAVIHRTKLNDRRMCSTWWIYVLTI